jgi:hypothetical protein
MISGDTVTINAENPIGQKSYKKDVGIDLLESEYQRGCDPLIKVETKTKVSPSKNAKLSAAGGGRGFLRRECY